MCNFTYIQNHVIYCQAGNMHIMVTHIDKSLYYLTVLYKGG